MGGVDGERGRCDLGTVPDLLDHGFVQRPHNQENANGYARERLQEVCRLRMWVDVVKVVFVHSFLRSSLATQAD